MTDKDDSSLKPIITEIKNLLEDVNPFDKSRIYP